MAISKKRFQKFAPQSEPLAFELAGETFECHPDLDYRVFNELMNQISEENQNGVERIIENITSFLANEDNRDRFNALVESDDTIIPASALLEIWRWLLREYKVIAPDEDATKRK